MPKCDFIEIALRRGCSPVNLVHVFRTSFPKKTPEGLLLKQSNPRGVFRIQSKFQDMYFSENF